MYKNHLDVRHTRTLVIRQNQRGPCQGVIAAGRDPALAVIEGGGGLVVWWLRKEVRRGRGAPAG